ncbi:MAG: Unknown protein [uncultured Sulfurovum sp.]|uniref:Uncharacterized protein n=1 Tax=uncultured Sulfurovum sp. TaxID=269237 RepID=A0A6S6TQK1_9BACT|nr:MAG: Unknown protein [uncultured Sulfurovum sp.]
MENMPVNFLKNDGFLMDKPIGTVGQDSSMFLSFFRFDCLNMLLFLFNVYCVQ